MFGDIGQWVQNVLGAAGPFGLFFLLLIENLFPPIPSELVLPLAGFLVGKGEIGAVQALVSSTAGSLVGAYILYFLGRWGGRSLVLRFGSVLRVTKEDLDQAQKWFEKYGGSVVFFARMVPGARSVVSIPAGTLEMPLVKFTVLTTAGSAVWNTLLIGAGWLLGENWSRITGIVGSVSDVLLIVMGILVAALVGWWLYSRWSG